MSLFRTGTMTRAPDLDFVAWRLVAAAVAAFIALIAWVASEQAPSLTIELRPANISAEQGRAYVATIDPRETWLYTTESDGPGGLASGLMLFEDRLLLGPSHTPHAKIRAGGDGRYSHWSGQLWFAASDSSDPRSNGRMYRVEVKQSLRRHWTISGRLAGLAAAALVFWAALAALYIWWRGRALPTWATSAISGTFRTRTPRLFLTSVLVSLAAVVGGGAAVLGWYVGDNTTTGLGVLRFLPISDAFGYHSCGTSVAAGGVFDEPFGAQWCGRRAIYPAMIAGLLTLTGWSSQLVLVFQGALIGASIAVLGLVASAVWGLLAAMTAVAILAVYAWEFVFGLYMTEFAGFVLGLAALSVLIAYCRTQNMAHLVLGVAFLSLGLFSRAGAVFALPALVLWSAIAPERTVAQRLRIAAATLVAAFVGFAVHAILGQALGADLASSGSNFSTSLYGLSTGSRDWSQAYRDFEADFAAGEHSAFQKIYAVAFANIRDHPGTFVDALLGATKLYFSSMFYFGELEPYSLLLGVLLIIGLVRCAIEWTSPLSSLLLVLAVAEVAAAPLIVDSGGVRVFAATVAVRAVICASGLHWLLRYVASRLGIAERWPEQIFPGGVPVAFAIGIAAFVGALALIPVTPLGSAARLAGADAHDCPAGLTAVVARVGRETQYMVVSDKAPTVHSLQPFMVGLGRLQADTGIRGTWWGADFLGLSPPVSIVRAVDLSSLHHAAVKPLFYRGVLAEQLMPVTMCVDPDSHLDLAGVRHFEIRQLVGPR